jgi:D-threonate/D-erythronate kinase
VPVSETIYGRDPLHPARCSTLADLVPSSIERSVLLDASTQDELDKQVAAIPDVQSVMWVGSPGMAVALARRLTPVPRLTAESDPQADVVVVGSANSQSHIQADRVTAMLGVTLLRSPTGRQDDPARVLQEIADDAASRIHHGSFSALIATGGETMDAILDRLSVHEFSILAELEPGFPVGCADLGAGRSIYIAMKAGGFGDNDTLSRAIARFRRSPFHHNG